MKTNYEIRYASHPDDAKKYDTARLRIEFLIEILFVRYALGFKEALYLGADDRTFTFTSDDAACPAKFYYNSTLHLHTKHSQIVKLRK